MGGSAVVVESLLSFRSVWDAFCARGVTESDVESLKCDSGHRFHKVPAQLS